jgi:hypothetical protein
MVPISREVRTTLDDVANALQVAIGLWASIKYGTAGTARDTVALEAALSRAVSALRRLQPSPTRRGAR